MWYPKVCHLVPRKCLPIEAFSRPHPRVGSRKCLPIEALSGYHPRVGSKNCLNGEALSKCRAQGALYYRHILACNWCGQDPYNSSTVSVNLSPEGGLTKKNKKIHDEDRLINLFNLVYKLIKCFCKIYLNFQW